MTDTSVPWRLRLATWLSLAGGVIGAWFAVHEHQYALAHRSSLAATLQWVGIAIALIGAAGAVGFSAVRERETRIHPPDGATGPDHRT